MEKADLIIKSKNIFTSNGEHAFDGFVAVANNKILEVGVRGDEENLISPSTKIFEFEDELVMPGFIDAHMHYFNGVFQNSKYMTRELYDCKSEKECIEIIRKFGEANPDFEKITGMGWFPVLWDNPTALPSKKSLDEIEPDRPVYLLAADGHTFWLNSKALELCDIDRDSEVSFGRIGKDEEGEPNGLLFDIEAEETANDLAFELPKEDAKDLIKDFNDELLSYGITSTTEMSVNPEPVGDFTDYAAAKELEDEGELKVRISLYPSLGIKPDTKKTEMLRDKYNSDKLRVAGLKQFIDGVSGTYTAYYLEAYADKPGYSGKPNYSYEVIRDCICNANKRGFPVRLHTVGDGAIRLALDAIEYSQMVNGKVPRELRNSLEHVESIAGSDISRFADLNVSASVQPSHVPPIAYEKLERIGEERSKYQWPFKSLLEAGCNLAFGTDFPVAPYNPFQGVYDAVARKDWNGNDIDINFEERLTLDQALLAYTKGSAYAIGMEDKVGTLEAGKYADIIVLDSNPFDLPTESLKEIKVKMTIADGEVVYG